MRLTQEKIEIIATSVIQGIIGNTTQKLEIVPIEEIAEQYYHLNIKYRKLSDDGHILGLTAYTKTNYTFNVNGKKEVVEIDSNDILLDEMFLDEFKKVELYGKHRFTLAHELAHQILFRLEKMEVKEQYIKQYAMRTNYTVKELKTFEDFCEWQANALGAALLMPFNTVRLLMYLINEEKALTNYDGVFSKSDYSVLKSFCDFFKVSKTAAIIRLRQLGYIVDRSFSEYIDPLYIAYD